MPEVDLQGVAFNGVSRSSYRWVFVAPLRQKHRIPPASVRVTGVQVQVERETILPLRSRPVPFIELKDHRQGEMCVCHGLVDREPLERRLFRHGHHGVRSYKTERGSQALDHGDTGMGLGIGGLECEGLSETLKALLECRPRHPHLVVPALQNQVVGY